MRSTIDRGGGNVGSKVQDGHMEIEPVPLTMRRAALSWSRSGRTSRSCAPQTWTIAELRNGLMEQEPAEYYL